MAWRLWRPKILSDSTFPFMTLGAIMGFGVFQYPVGRPRMLISAVYVISMSLLFWSVFFKSVKSFKRSQFSAANNAINYYLNHVNQMTTVGAQILSFCHIKKYLRVIDRLVEVDKTLYKLGASFDYRQCLLVRTLNLSFWIILMIVQCILRILWLYNRLPLNDAIILTILTKYATIINITMGLQFWTTSWYIGHKFYAINKLLEEPFKHIYRRFESDDFGTTLQKKAHVTSFNMSLCRHFMNGVDRTSFIQIIKHVHLEVTLITRDFNEVYSGLILLAFAEDFVLFTSRSYLLCDVLTRLQVNRRLILATAAVAWLIPCFLKMLLINSICDSVTNEAKRTGNLIFHFTHAGDDPEFSAEIKQFGYQLYNIPVRFSPLGFFVLGYKFVRGFFGTVLTYLIIVIQADTGDTL